MSEVWGALAQSLPAATTLTDAYTVPAEKHGTVEVIMCNRGAQAAIRLAHAKAGAVDANAQYLLFDAILPAADTRTTARFTVGAGDILRAYSDTGAVAFNINGIEE